MLRAPRLGVLELFEHHHAGPLAHDKAVAVAVVGARGALRLIVEIGRQRAAGGKAGDRQSGRPATSVPPASITSASPSATSREASPMACAPVEQAVTTAWFGPLRPCSIET